MFPRWYGAVTIGNRWWRDLWLLLWSRREQQCGGYRGCSRYQRLLQRLLGKGKTIYDDECPWGLHLHLFATRGNLFNSELIQAGQIRCTGKGFSLLFYVLPLLYAVQNFCCFFAELRALSQPHLLLCDLFTVFVGRMSIGASKLFVSLISPSCMYSHSC